jgi:hypothetical protein
MHVNMDTEMAEKHTLAHGKQNKGAANYRKRKQEYETQACC